MPIDVFISYNSKDLQWRDDLVAFLSGNGISYFLDANGLELGKAIDDGIRDNLRAATFTLMIVTRNSLLSSWVGMEAMFRIKEEEVLGNTKLICIVMEKEVFDLEFPIQMQEHFAQLKVQLEGLRSKMIGSGGDPEVYDVEIQRLNQLSAGRLMKKVRGHLGVAWYDDVRRESDLQNLLAILKKGKQLLEHEDSSPLHPAQAAYDLAKVHLLLNTALSDTALRELCLLHFPKVYNDVGSQQSKAQVLHTLLDHAQRHLQMARLLKLLLAENPGMYQAMGPYER